VTHHQQAATRGTAVDGLRDGPGPITSSQTFELS
jgi:hypothetical protein